MSRKKRRLSRRGKKIIMGMLACLCGIGIFSYKPVRAMLQHSEAGNFMTCDGNKEMSLQNWQKINPNVRYVLNFPDKDGSRVIPVVETDDPSFYLDHNVFKRKDSMGAPFIDHVMDGEDRNTVIYGHSSAIKDWNFTFLKNYADTSYFHEYPYFTVESDSGEDTYIILMIGRYDLSDESEECQWSSATDSAEELTDMLQEASLKALQIRKGIAYNGQQIITLVTCDMRGKDDRYVLSAVHI